MNKYNTQGAMQLTAEERQMIEAMRIANKAQVNPVGYSRMAKKDLLSSIDYNIQVALESSNPEVRAGAETIKAQLAEAGYRSLAEAEKDISVDQIQTLINVVHTASQYDEAIDYDMTASQAILFKEIPDDDTYQEVQTNSLRDMKQEQESAAYQEEVVVENPLTGTKFIQQSDGTMTPYIDKGSEEYLASVSASSDEAFMQNGGEIGDDWLGDLQVK